MNLSISRLSSLNSSLRANTSKMFPPQRSAFGEIFLGAKNRLGSLPKDQVHFGVAKAIKPIEPSKIKFSFEASNLLKNVFKMIGPPPLEVSSTLNMMSLLLSEPSVNTYLSKTCRIQPSAISKGIDSECIPAYEEDQRRSGLADVRLNKDTQMRPLIEKLQQFAANEQESLITPVVLWRWIMKTDPSQNLDTLLQLSKLDASRIARLREAQKPADPFGDETGPLPVEEIIRLRDAVQKLSKIIIGQDPVIEEIGNGVLKAYDGYSLENENPNKPRVRFLLTGPSGVGKTFTVKQLAKVLNRDLIYLTMTEYMDGQDAKKMTGSGPGYIGFGDPCFVDKVIAAIKKAKEEGRRAPIILFDEVEKAHRDVIKTLMQVLDDGQMENSLQDIAYFKDCMIFMTSNLAQREIAEAQRAGKSKEAVDAIVADVLKEKLDPEVRGRLNKTLVFQALHEEDARKIMDQQIGDLVKAAANRDKYLLEVESSMRDQIMKKGYTLDTGAREIKNYIETYVHDPLVPQIQDLRVAKIPIEGGQMHVEWKEEKPFFKFTPATNPPPEKPKLAA